MTRLVRALAVLAAVVLEVACAGCSSDAGSRRNRGAAAETEVACDSADRNRGGALLR